MTDPGVGRLSLSVGTRDHIQGPDDAPVTLIEYGDFECPHCGWAYPIVKEVLKRLGDQLRFVFRHFPISTVHPHAKSAAEAAETAGGQGKFWEMHDYLFEHQDALDDEHLRKYAIALGLNVERYDKDMVEHTYAQKVREDFLSGVRSGANGTPTFFINDVRYDGLWDVDNLHRALKEEMERSLNEF